MDSLLHPLRPITGPALLAFCFALTACADDADPEVDDTERARIDFTTEVPAYETLEIESGPQMVAEGVVMWTVTRYDATWALEASGVARGDRVDPIDQTGLVSLQGEVTVDVYATVTLPDHEFDGLVGSQTFDATAELAHFDPFLIDEPWVLGLDMPNELEIRFDPASGRGLAFVVEMSITYLPTYEGTCLAVDDDAQAAQYTGILQPIADFKHVFAVELVSGLGNTRLGQLGLDVELDDLGLEVDLGTYSLDDGESVDGSAPCGR